MRINQLFGSMLKDNFYKINDELNEKIINYLLNENLIDIYQLPKFNLINKKKDEELFFFINLRDKEIFYMPIIVKKIKNNNSFFFETLHGYSGPISNSIEESFLIDSWKKFYKNCVMKNIISGFIRFNPFLKNHLIAKNIDFIKIENAKQIIFSKLDQKYDFYYSKYSKNVKKNLKNFKKNKLKLIQTINQEYINKFLELYLQSMEEKSSLKSYRYNLNYFNDLFKYFSANIGLISVLESKDNNYLSGLLYIKFNNIIHVHLSCSNKLGKKYSAPFGMRNFLFEKFAGTSNIINFGGGLTNQKNDSLFSFKKGFSDDYKDYFIGKVVINKDLHNEFSRKFSSIENNIFKDMHIPYMID